VVCADGAQLILATNLVATSADAPSFAQTILNMQSTIGLPKRVLADTGYASGPAVAAVQAHGIEPIVAIGFRRFSLRGITKAVTEWTLIALACNCKRMVTLGTA
jgi:hypothetical protein